MRIDFARAKSVLESENRGLDTQMGRCVEQANALSSFTSADYGLEGAAYAAVEERLRGRAAIARAYWLLFDAIREGNARNLAELGKLESPHGDGAVDTDECERMVRERLGQIERMGRQRDQQAAAEKRYGYSAEWREHTRRLWEQQIAVVAADKDEWQRMLGLAEWYSIASKSFYHQAESVAGDVLSKARQAAQTALSSGTYPAMDWIDELNKRYGKAMRGFKLAIAKKTLNKNEYAAYEKAMKDGKITVDELYQLQEGGKSRKLNEDLWKALNHLPSNAIGDEEARACVEAMGSMVGANDVVSLKRVLEYSFVPTGQSIKKAFPAGTGAAMVELPVYAFRKSALLERMSTVSDSTAASFGPGSQAWRDTKNDELPRLRSRWADMMATSQLLHLAAGNVKPQGWDDDPSAVWGSSSDRLHLEVGIALPSDNADSTARLVTLETERYWQNDPRMANQSAYNDWAHQVSAGISGTPGDVYRMLAQRSGKSPNFNWLDSTGKQLAQAAIDKVIGILPRPVSEALSTAYGIGAGILDDLDGAKATARQTTLGNVAGKASGNPLLNDLGFAMTFDGSDGGYEGNYMHPNNRLIMTETTRGNINATVRDYNALHAGSDITADEVISDLAGNPIDTIKEAKENVKYNSVTNQKDYDPKNEGTNSDFLRWCKQDADLQYVNDSGTHKAGDTFRGLSNYTYSTYKDSDYRDLERVPGTGTH